MSRTDVYETVTNAIASKLSRKVFRGRLSKCLGMECQIFRKTPAPKKDIEGLMSPCFG
jgi:hypothetical protein